MKMEGNCIDSNGTGSLNTFAYVSKDIGTSNIYLFGSGFKST
jgi:hypothetical protein